MSFYLRRGDEVSGPIEAPELRTRLCEGTLVSTEPEGPFVAVAELCAVGSRGASRLAQALELPSPTLAGPGRVFVAWVVALDLLAAFAIGASLRSASWSAFAVVAALLLAAGLVAAAHRWALPFAALVSVAVASDAMAAAIGGRGPWFWPAAHGVVALQCVVVEIVLRRRRRALLSALGAKDARPVRDRPAPGVVATLSAFGSAYALYASIVFAYHRARYPEAEAPITLMVWGAGLGAMAVRASLYVLLALAALWLLRQTRALPDLGLGPKRIAGSLLPATLLFFSVVLGLSAIDSIVTLLASHGPATEAVASFQRSVGADARASSSAGRSPAVIAYAGLLGPVTEELVFRGVLYPALRSKVPNAVAITGSALAFAVLHPYGAALYQVAIVGILSAVAYDRTRSLWPSILAHSAWNLMLTLG